MATVFSGLAARDSGQDPASAVEQAINGLDGNGELIRSGLYAAAHRLFTSGDSPPSRVPISVPEVPELPDYARLPNELSRVASFWLDTYIAFSQEWSPRAYEDFHEACAM